MKLCKFFIILTLMTIIFSGCGNTPIENPKTLDEKIKEAYTSFPPYSVSCTADIKSNKTENKYEFKIKYINENLYRIDYDDHSMIVKDGEVYIKKGDIEVKTVSSNRYFNFMPSTFFNYYFTSGTGEMSINGSDAKLTADIPGGNIYQTAMTLLIDSADISPKELEITGFDGETKMDIKYNDFKIIEDTNL